MSANHPKLEAWDMAIHQIIVKVENILEERFGSNKKLRRNRPPHGSTANPQMDGMFNLGLVFTPGFGSELGRGYWLDLEIAARDNIEPSQYEIYLLACKNLVEEELQRVFPDRGLRFYKDSGRWKLQGDFGLGGI